MAKIIKAERAPVSREHQDLVLELAKQNPDQKEIKRLFSKCGLSYSPDPIEQMSRALELISNLPIKFQQLDINS